MADRHRGAATSLGATVNERTPVPPRRPARRPARRRSRLGGLAVGLAAAFALLPGAAHAENSVVGSSPEDGASIGDSPAEIQITFAEELGEVNTMVVECNTELSTIGRPRVGDDGLTLSAEVVEPLPRGTCVVRWGVSNTDGEPNGVGNITFTVENEPAVVETTVPDTAADGTAPSGTATDGSTTGDGSAPDGSSSDNDEVADLAEVDAGQGPLWLGRLLSVFGIAVLFGSLVVIAAAWPEGVEYLLTVRFVRGAWIVAFVGTVLYLAAATAAVTDGSLGSSLSPVAWLDLLDAGTAGIAALARIVFVLAAAWVAFRPDRVIDPVTQMMALGVPGLAVVTIGFSRTDTDLAIASIAMGVLHALAMAVWVGGVVLLARVVLAGPGEEDLVHAVRGFARLSNVAIGVTILTGIVQMVILDSGDLFGSSHGAVVLLKTVVVAVMVFVAMSARQFVNQRLARANEMTIPMADRLRRAFGVEAVAGAVVLAMSAWLLSLSPPNVDTGPVIDYAVERRIEAPEADIDVTVQLTRDTVGTAGLRVEVDAPEENLSGLEIVFTAPPNDTIGTITQPVPLTEPGVAVRLEENGIPLTIAGDWTLAVNAQTDLGVFNSDPQSFTILNADGSVPTTELTIPPVVTVTIAPTTTP